MNFCHKKTWLRWKLSNGSCSWRLKQQKQAQEQESHRKEGQAQTNTEM